MVDAHPPPVRITFKTKGSRTSIVPAHARAATWVNVVGNLMTAYPISASTAYVVQPAAWMACSMGMKPQSIVVVDAHLVGPAQVAADPKIAKAEFVRTASARPCAAVMA